MTDGTTPPGWYPDPLRGHESRYWNGSSWTDNVADRGIQSTAPMDAPPQPPVATPTAPPPVFGSPDDARAQAKAAKAYAKAKRPWYKKKRWWALGAVAILVIIAIASAGSSSSKTSATNNNGASTLSNNGKHPPQKDVQIATCNKDEFGFMQASVKVTNHSSEKSNYIITVAFETPNGKTQLGTGTALVDDLQSGQVGNDIAGSLKKAPATNFICKVTEVNRFAST